MGGAAAGSKAFQSPPASCRMAEKAPLLSHIRTGCHEMDLTPQDLIGLRNVVLRAVHECHDILAAAARRTNADSQLARSHAQVVRTPNPPASPSPLPPTHPKLLYSIKEASQALGLGRTKLYVMIKDGSLPAMHIGRRTLIKASDIDALIAQAGQR